MNQHFSSVMIIALMTIMTITTAGTQTNSTKIKTTMTQQDEKTVEGLKTALNRLINAEPPVNIDLFHAIYHEDMQVIMLDDNGEKMVFDKSAFMKLIDARLKEGNIHTNRWTKFNHVEINGDNGHVVVTRKVNLTGTKNKLTLSIDFVWEDDRWQITREVIFSQPID